MIMSCTFLSGVLCLMIKSLNIFHVFSKKVSAEIFPLERRLHKPRLVALRIFRTKRGDRSEKWRISQHFSRSNEI